MTNNDGYLNNTCKWDREQVEKYFIQHPEELTIVRLAKISNRGSASIARWRVKYRWADKRQEYWGAIREETREKTIEKVTEIFASEVEKLTQAHLTQYKKFAKLGDLVLNTIIADINSSEDRQSAIRRIDIKSLNQLFQMCDRAMRGAGETVGLYFHVDSNAAIKSVESMGYVIIDPTAQEMNDRMKSLEAEVKQVD